VTGGRALLVRCDAWRRCKIEYFLNDEGQGARGMRWCAAKALCFKEKPLFRGGGAR